MCGIAGVLTFGGTPLRIERLKNMVDVLAHRGPDDAGYLVWQTGADHPRGLSYGQALTDCQFHDISPLLPTIDTGAGQQLLHDNRWNLFLGHRRLSIIDLSPRGHQPMAEETANVWICYNGEVYNFRELRAELESLGHRFVSKTDTEVLLKAYEQWGPDCVRRFNGMFAFALWDNRTKTLRLARDRYGIKPLYYYRDQHTLIFASEIKSILEYLPSKPGVDLLALNEYFSFQNVLTARTLFSGIRVLPPAAVLTVDVKSGASQTSPYWDFEFDKESALTQRQLEETLRGLIEQAVRRQCVSDVPIGSYLSGGMDSGTVAALAAKNLGRICTFTAGFDLSEATEREQSFDERERAENMASVFQTEHYECVLHAGDLEAAMARLVYHLEDLRVGQCYPNYYVSRLAGKFVRVVFSGGGGDELFGGYPWRYAAALGADHDDYIRNYYRYWKRLVPNSAKPKFFAPEIVSQLRQMEDETAVPFRDHTLNVFKRVFDNRLEIKTLEDQVNHALYFECKTFLRGLLMVEDKVSMAHSLETRLPLLDNDLVDFACTVPVGRKVSNLNKLVRLDENEVRKKRAYAQLAQGGKNILRNAMETILPPEITQARKQGFSAPDESWFRGRAENYVRDMLLGSDTRCREFFNQVFVRDILDAHAGKRKNHRLLIWSLLSFEQWLRLFQ